MLRAPSTILVAALLAGAGSVPARAGDPAFDTITYQGQLEFQGEPATPPVDLKFRLYDVGGSQVGSEIQALDYADFDVDGRFTIGLMFGAAAFNGAERFLEIEVEGQILTPRQPIRATPYAVHALGVSSVADSALSANVALKGSANVFTANNVFTARVGVGANPPGAPIHVRAAEGIASGFSSASQVALEPASDNNDAAISLRTTRTASDREWSVRAGSGAGNTNFRIFDATANADRINIDANGDVGIATTNPLARLHVAPPPASDLFTVLLPGMRLYMPPAEIPNVLGGSDGNTMSAGIFGATIGGGGGFAVNLPNSVSGNHGTVGGGHGNSAAVRATVGGGVLNTASADGAAVGGGEDNAASAVWATVSGGFDNEASGQRATVAGGEDNVASGAFAMVAGGLLNTASGGWTFAGGRQAKATHTGSFVWGGGTNSDVGSTADETFIVRASGGVWFGTVAPASIPAGRFINTSTGGYLNTGGFWTNSSSRDVKENFRPVDPRQVAADLAKLPIRVWNYKVDDASVVHMGPVAEEFAELFGLGADDRAIGTIDADGVALAAIQGVYDLVREKDAEIAELKARLAAIEARLPAR